MIPKNVARAGSGRKRKAVQPKAKDAFDVNLDLAVFSSSQQIQGMDENEDCSPGVFPEAAATPFHPLAKRSRLTAAKTDPGKSRRPAVSGPAWAAIAPKSAGRTGAAPKFRDETPQPARKPRGEASELQGGAGTSGRRTATPSDLIACCAPRLRKCSDASDSSLTPQAMVGMEFAAPLACAPAGSSKPVPHSSEQAHGSLQAQCADHTTAAASVTGASATAGNAQISARAGIAQQQDPAAAAGPSQPPHSAAASAVGVMAAQLGLAAHLNRSTADEGAAAAAAALKNGHGGSWSPAAVLTGATPSPTIQAADGENMLICSSLIAGLFCCLGFSTTLRTSCTSGSGRG